MPQSSKSVGHIPLNAPQAIAEEEINTTVQRQLPGQWLRQLDAMMQHAAQSAGGIFSQNDLMQAIRKNGGVKPDADELEVYLLCLSWRNFRPVL